MKKFITLYGPGAATTFLDPSKVACIAPVYSAVDGRPFGGSTVHLDGGISLNIDSLPEDIARLVESFASSDCAQASGDDPAKGDAE